MIAPARFFKATDPYLSADALRESTFRHAVTGDEPDEPKRSWRETYANPAATPNDLTATPEDQLAEASGESIGANRIGQIVNEPPFDASTDDAARETPPARSGENGTEGVIEVFQGRIERIMNGVAFVILESEDGTQFTGERPASEFSQLGLGEGNYFQCKTIEKGSSVYVVIEPPTVHPVSSTELAELDLKLSELYGD